MNPLDLKQWMVTGGVSVALAAFSLVLPGTALAQSQRANATETSPTMEPSPMTAVIETINEPASVEHGAENLAAFEIDLFLDELQRREQSLDRREQALRNQEETLRAMITEIDAKFTELQAIRDEIDQRLTVVDTARNQRITSLAEWCAGMEPSQAAAHLSTQTDIGIVVSVLEAMEARKASAVLEEMDSTVAAQVIQQMSQRR